MVDDEEADDESKEELCVIYLLYFDSYFTFLIIFFLSRPALARMLLAYAIDEFCECKVEGRI
jgi:hypothetical protein